MKNLFTLTKTLLVAAGLCVGANAWGDDTPVTLPCASSIAILGTNYYTAGDGNGSNYSSTIYLNSYAGNGGAGGFAFTLDNDWDASKVKSASLQIYPISNANKKRNGDIYIRSLDAFPTASSTSTSYSEGKHVVYSYGSANTKRYAYSTTTVATVSANVNGSSSVPAIGAYYSIDVTNYFQGLTTKSAGDLVYMGIDISDWAADITIGAYGHTYAPKLVITYTNETLYTATFTETNSLSPTVTIYSDEGMTSAVTNGTLTNGTTYYYKAVLTGYHDYTGSFTVGGANPSVDFTMTAKSTFTYTKRAVCGSDVLNASLATKTDYEGETITLLWSKYIKVDGLWYVATESTYQSSSTVSATEDVEYSLSNIADFYEMESLTRSGGVYLTETSGSYSGGSRLRLSKGSLYYTPALTGGVYTLSIPWENGNETVNEVYVYTRSAGGVLSEKLKTFTANKGSGTFTYVITVPDGYSIAFNGNEGGSSNNNARMDYMTLTPTVTIGTNGYTTFSSAYPLALGSMTASEGDVTAYYASTIGESSVTLTSIAANVEAGEGLILKGTAGATITIPVAASGLAISNYLVGCPTATELTTPNSNYYVMVNNGAGVEFQSLTGSYTDNKVTIPAGKAYLNVAAAGSRLNIIFDDDNTTSISTIANSQEPTANSYYDLQGRRVAQPSKGLYIVNGKKVVVK